MIKIGIVDNDENVVTKIKKILEEKALEKDIHCMFSEFNNLKDINKLLQKKEHFDVIFLETEVSGENTIEFGEKIKKIDKNTEIIFLSDKMEYIFDCIDIGAFNFFLKPIDENARLSAQFERLLLEKFMDRVNFLAIKRNAGGVVVEISKILYIETMDKQLRVHYKDKFVDVNETMAVLEKRLSNSYFIRAHKSFLVNARHVRRVEKQDVHLDDGTIIPISRLRLKDFKTELRKYFKDKDYFV
ncbi:MAG: LytR/AlgR family response regulator transcription factor [Clostridium sp.]